MALEATVLPELTPVLVATRREVDAVVKEGRAEVARLALELKSHLRDVAELERLVDDPGPPGSPELVLAAIDTQKRAQRQTFAEEVEKVTAEASALVAAARAQADALIAEASRSSTDVLRRTIQPTLPPSVRIQGADLAAAPAPPPLPIAPPVTFQSPPLNGAPLAAVSQAAAPPAESPAAAGPATAEQATVAASSARKLRSLLYADVLIPVIGAVIILVILLAWIG